MDAKWQKRAGYLKKGENWLIPGFCCLILFLAAGLAWDYYYDLNDDVLIRDILSGVYTGEPEALTAQLLWPLGALLAGLYRLLPGLPVFGAFLWLCQAGSVFLILRRSLLWLEARAGGKTPAFSGQDGAEMPAFSGQDGAEMPAFKRRSSPARSGRSFCCVLRKPCLRRSACCTTWYSSSTR